jgi:hypothetical protein
MRHQVAEPLMRQFVMEQPVKTIVATAKFIAVRVDGLVFHAEMRSFRNPELFLAPWIGPELAFVILNCRCEFGIE